MAPRRVKVQAPKVEPRVSVFKLHLHRACIFTSYCQLMKDIYEELNKDGELVNGKLVTPKSGIFLVQLVPEKDDELPLTFLFRRNDLYVESYHYDRVWYRFSDHDAELPSKDQLDYTQIVKLVLSSSYAHLSGYNIKIGHAAFNRCYYVLRKTNVLHSSKEGLGVLKSGPLATPAVGISEALRFSFQQRLISNKLWVIKRQMLEVTAGEEDEKLSAFLYEWQNKDQKRIVEAVCNIGDIRDTVKLYTEGLGMKVMRTKVSDKNMTCFLGFGSEKTNFALQLDFNHGITKYDTGEGFGHFTVAVENVSKVEKRIISNGGKINRAKGRLGDAVFAADGDGYKFELIERSSAPEPLCGIMLRIGDLQRSITFYRKGSSLIYDDELTAIMQALGMKLFTMITVPEFKYTTVKLGYANEDKATVLELRYTYEIEEYQQGNAYSQLVIATDNVHKSAEVVKRMVKLLGGKILQQPESLTRSQLQTATFLDPEGWKVVLVDKVDFLAEIEKTSAA